MNKKILHSILYVFLAAVAAGVLVGCDKDLVGVNESPNAIRQENLATPAGMKATLVGMQSAVGDWYADERSRILSVWTLQVCAPSGLGRPQPVTWNTYKMVDDEHADRSWNQAYRVVKLANDIINNVGNVSFETPTTETRNVYLGMAKFFKALALGECAALYGSIPIDVAKAPGGEPPVYVSQGAAYAEVQKLLTEAIGHFGTTTTISHDLNFQGNSAKWLAACYSLKARYFLHLKNYAEALNNSNQGITAAANTVNGIYSLTLGEYAPWGHWSQTEVGEPLRAAKYYVDLLKSESGDNRLSSYFRIVTGSGATAIVGHDVHNELGGTGDELVATRAAGHNKYRPFNQPFPLISYNENVLIRAEAKARTGNVAGAVADLNIARSAAGLSAFSSTDATATISQILKQKNLWLFLEGQTYHDMRRTGTLPRTGIPLRWIYGQSEKTTNPNTPPDPASGKNELL